MSPPEDLLQALDELAFAPYDNPEAAQEAAVAFVDLLEGAGLRQAGAAWALPRYQGRHTLVTVGALSFALAVRAFDDDPAQTREGVYQLSAAAQALEDLSENVWVNCLTALKGAHAQGALLPPGAPVDDRLFDLIDATAHRGGVMSCEYLVDFISLFWSYDRMGFYAGLGLARQARLLQALWRLGEHPHEWVQRELAAYADTLPPAGCFSLVGGLERDHG
jgi:hypothetical protein